MLAGEGFGPSVPDKPSNSVNLLISMLMRYPELASVNLDPASQALSFVFLVREGVSRDRLRSYRRRLQAALRTLWSLSGWCPGSLRLRAATLGGLTTLEMARDLDSLSQQEVSLIVELTREEFGDALAREEADASAEDELAAQEEAIGEMLENIKGSHSDRKVTAVREDGRVLVFNQ
ncbi:MAG: hypothetical protein K6T75_07815 [Acetobacteraceae bacterium]|nr:hypothetical protein [Acetobacteraceae bacterium]